MTKSGSMRRGRPRIRARFDPENDATVFYGDCKSLLAQLPDACVQLVVTSPPYNIGKSYERRMTLEEYLEMHRGVIDACVRVLKPGGSICWQVGNHINGHQQIYPLDILLHPLFAAYESSCGLRLRNRIIWHFEHGLHAARKFSGRYESILWYTKGDEYIFDLDAVRVAQKYPGKKHYKGAKRGEYSGNPLGKNPGDVWIFPNVKSNHVEKTRHPCQFPLELASRLIRALTNPGDLVLDPFLGSGTTVAAAILHSRRGVGSEIRREYALLARARAKSAWRGTLPSRPERRVHEPPKDTSLTTPPPNFRASLRSAD